MNSTTPPKFACAIQDGHQFLDKLKLTRENRANRINSPIFSAFTNYLLPG